MNGIINGNAKVGQAKVYGTPKEMALDTELQELKELVNKAVGYTIVNPDDFHKLLALKMFLDPKVPKFQKISKEQIMEDLQ